MKIMLTGANGQLGLSLLERFPECWEIEPLSSNQLDITDAAAVMAAVEKIQPDIIINAAAYTAVDKAESEPDKAASVNVDGPKNLALAAKGKNTKLIHVSTDYVFDGLSNTPYKETDPTNPLGVYGKTKLMGEKTIQEISKDSIILRTAWVFSEHKNNFMKTMLRLANERGTLSIIDDQRGCPTYAGDIANALIKLAENRSSHGIYHYCGNKITTWARFAEFIFKHAYEKRLINNEVVVQYINTDEYPTPAKRPAYSVLSGDKINLEGIGLSDWEERVKEVILKIEISSDGLR